MPSELVPTFYNVSYDLDLVTRLSPDLPIETWAEFLFATVEQMHRDTWLVVDLLAWGEDVYGEAVHQYTDRLGLAHGTVANFRWVGRRFPPSRRRELPALPVGHYQELAPLSLPDQERYARLAADNGWTRADLRQQLREDGLKTERDASEVYLENDALRAEADAQARRIQELEDHPAESAYRRDTVPEWIVPSELVRLLREAAAALDGTNPDLAARLRQWVGGE
jgi:hypothetical protein